MAGETLLVGHTETGCLVRVQGRGTMHVSPSLSVFVQELLGREPNATVLVDLDRAEYLDSTFLGGLVALSQRFSRCEPPRFFIAASVETCARLLKPMRLDEILHFREASASDPCGWCALPPTQLDARELGRYAMLCHQRLAELGGPHAEVFSRVAEQLAKELGEKV